VRKAHKFQLENQLVPFWNRFNSKEADNLKEESRFTRHINNIVADGELDEKSVVRKTHFALFFNISTTEESSAIAKFVQ
jgi:hypothetical protein